jgi:hypothetical protein
VNEHPFELRHEVKRLNKRFDQIADTLERVEFRDILETYSSPKKRIISNLTVGIARGLDLTLGTAVTMVSVFVISLPLNADMASSMEISVSVMSHHSHPPRKEEICSCGVMDSILPHLPFPAKKGRASHMEMACPYYVTSSSLNHESRRFMKWTSWT